MDLGTPWMSKLSWTTQTMQALHQGWLTRPYRLSIHLLTESIYRVNVVDIIYSSLPAYLYFNPDLAGYLLSPLLEYQDSAQYQLPYAARNIGTHPCISTGSYL